MIPEANKIQLSVIIPTLFANSEYFNEAIASIERQSFRNFEVLVLVDGPITDYSRFNEIMSQLSVTYRVYFAKKKRGVSRSLNILARLAVGEYLVRMDDDDICVDERFQIQFEEISACKHDVLGSSVNLIDKNGKSLNKILSGFDFHRPASNYDLLFKDIFFHPSVVMRKAWWKENKYDRNWSNGQDRELWIRTYGHSRFFNLDQALLKYRVRSRGHITYLRSIKNKRMLLKTYRSNFGIKYPIMELFLFALYVRCLLYNKVRMK